MLRFKHLFFMFALAVPFLGTVLNEHRQRDLHTVVSPQCLAVAPALPEAWGMPYISADKRVGNTTVVCIEGNCSPLSESAGSATDLASIFFEGRKWASSDIKCLARVSYRGHEALSFRSRGPNSFAFVEDLDFRFGVIEFDLASDSRSAPTIGIYGGTESEQSDSIAIQLIPSFHDRENTSRLEQAVVTVRERTHVVLRAFTEETPAEGKGFGDWFHLRLELTEDQCRFFLDNDVVPAFAMANLFHKERGGRIGLCARNCYVKRFRASAEIE